jgi:SAM-dependent methyltransferase
MDPKQVVAAGYDRIAEDYASAGRDHPDPVRTKYLAVAMGVAEPGARALDLGCSTGALVTATLATRYEVVGVDISERSLELARAALPSVEFVAADMAQVGWPAASFAVVTAFYSLIHLPAGEHADLLARIANWLRPGGTFIATFSAAPPGDSRDDDWMGVPMYWSSSGPARTLELLRDAGFSQASAGVETVDEGHAVAQHLWVVANTPYSGG